MIDKKFVYAVVGASANPEKYGNKVLADLLAGDYKVIPVNPKGGKILGQKVFPVLSEIFHLPDVVIFVVPPPVAMAVLKEAKDLRIKKFWFQPGSESEEIKNFCQENKLDAVFDACIMVERKK